MGRDFKGGDLIALVNSEQSRGAAGHRLMIHHVAAEVWKVASARRRRFCADTRDAAVNSLHVDCDWVLNPSARLTLEPRRDATGNPTFPVGPVSRTAATKFRSEESMTPGACVAAVRMSDTAPLTVESATDPLAC